MPKASPTSQLDLGSKDTGSWSSKETVGGSWDLPAAWKQASVPVFGYFFHSTSVHERQFNMAVEIMSNLYRLSRNMDVFVHLHGSLGLNFHPVYILVHELWESRDQDTRRPGNSAVLMVSSLG